jgi:hypothetical protein
VIAIEEAIKTTNTAEPPTINHVGIEASDEFKPLVAEPHFSRGVKAKIIADVHVSMMFAMLILNLSL